MSKHKERWTFDKWHRQVTETAAKQMHYMAANVGELEDISQEIWLWTLEAGQDGRTGLDRMRGWYDDYIPFKNAVRSLKSCTMDRVARLFALDEMSSGAGGGNDEDVADYTLNGTAAVPYTDIAGPLSAAMSGLPAHYADVLRLTYGEGLTDPEIEALTGLKQATIRSHRRRALAKLRTVAGLEQSQEEWQATITRMYQEVFKR